MSDTHRPERPSIPAQRLTPQLVVRNGVQALEFYTKAFGAVEMFRLMEPGGRLGHAELSIGGACFMLADEYPEYGIVGPESLGGASSSLSLYVEDVDAFVSRAVEAGATLERPVTDEFYGDRVGHLRDPFGHRWGIAQRIEEAPAEEMQRRFERMFTEQG